jgi:homoserine O-succinyltransferase/O-acetyltransferase
LSKVSVKAAIIDLYNNEKNEGMRCIKEIVSGASDSETEITFDVFDCRYKCEIPDLSYDIYISSGGPGSPFEGEGMEWETKYFNLLDDVIKHNQRNDNKKYFFFICHSFQMMARYFKFADVTERPKKSFGVLPVKLTEEGVNDPLFSGMPNPIYAADFRQYQVVNKKNDQLKALDAKVLAVEVDNNKKEDELAIMAVRIGNEIAGTQFHPEADPESMMYHFKQDERKTFIIENFGEPKYWEMLELLEQEDKIKLTRKKVLPGFIENAINNILTMAGK